MHWRVAARQRTGSVRGAHRADEPAWCGNPADCSDPLAAHHLLFVCCERCRSPLGRPSPPGERPGGTAPRQVRGALSFRLCRFLSSSVHGQQKGTPNVPGVPAD